MKKEFAKYTIFSILGMLGLSCYILADTFFVSRALGTDGLAALNLAIPAYSVINGCGLMLGVGGGTLFAQFRARGDKKGADRIFTASLVMALLPAVIGLVVGGCFAEILARKMGAQGTVLQMSETYLRIILLGAPFFLINNVVMGFVRNDGAPRLAMTAMLAGSFSNIVLDWLFMFPLKMGIFGAVLATCMAPVISLAVLMPHVLGKDCGFHLCRKPEVHQCGGIVSAGMPSMLAEISAAVVMIVFNTLMLEAAGTVGVAAYGVVANLALVVTAVLTGAAQGAQPLLSRCYGAGQHKELQDVRNALLGTELILTVCIYIGIALGAQGLAGAFNSAADPDLQRIAVRGMRLYFLSCPFAGLNIALSMVMTCAQRGRRAQILSLLRGFVLLLPAAICGALWWGQDGIFCALPAAEMLSAVVGICLMRHASDASLT